MCRHSSYKCSITLTTILLALLKWSVICLESFETVGFHKPVSVSSIILTEYHYFGDIRQFNVQYLLNTKVFLVNLYYKFSFYHVH